MKPKKFEKETRIKLVKGYIEKLENKLKNKNLTFTEKFVIENELDDYKLELFDLLDT